MNSSHGAERTRAQGSVTRLRDPRVLVVTPTRGERDLRALLACLRRQAGSVEGARILVIHNAHQEDTTLSTLVRRHDAMYVHVPHVGFSSARNAALEAAGGYDILCFIDDDELPQGDWLRSHVDGLVRWDADILLGPVDVAPPAHAPAWLDGGRLIREKQHRPDGPTAGRLYSGNTSIRVEFFNRHNLRFDPRYNLTGGEDTEFFARCRNHGAKVAWSQHARVTETPDRERLTIRWLVERNYRGGREDAVRRISIGYERGSCIAARKTVQIARGLCRLAVGAVARRPPTWARGVRDLASAAGTLRGLTATCSPHSQPSARGRKTWGRFVRSMDAPSGLPNEPRRPQPRPDSARGA